MRTTSLLLGLLMLTLTACGSSGAARSAGGPEANAAAMVPLQGNDLEVPEFDARRPAAPRPAQPTAREPLPAPAQPDRGPRKTGPMANYQPREMPTATGPQIRVTWEALAVEQERLANPRIKRAPQLGLAVRQKVVVVNEGHLEAQTSRQLGVTSAKNRGTAVGAVANADMQKFLKHLERRGFFKHAKPTASLQSQFDSSNARGRITIERGGRSYTLISMRGQGLDPRTKHIPGLYSETKQAIMMLRNRTSCMGVIGVRGGVLTR